MGADLAGRVALVTGSASGIGAAVARALDGAGMRVVVNSRKSVDAGRAVADELTNGAYIQADVADPEQARELVAQAVDRWGRLDVLVNNAGTTAWIPHRDLDAVTDEVWHTILDTNVIGTWNVTRAAVPALRESPDGSVVIIGSLSGVRPGGSSIPYAVSKAAVHHMAKLLAAVLGPEVRVNAVAPGLIETPWTAHWEEARENVRANAPLRRSGDPAEIAESVLGLVRSTYVTGDVLVADGGLQLR